MSNGKNGSVLIPGMETFVQPEKEEEFFWDGEKKATYFDAAQLPDTPAYQKNANNATTYLLYIIFPDYDLLVRAITALTSGKRKSLAPGSRTGSLNGVYKDADGKMFLEIWEEKMMGKVKPKRKKAETDDEAQPPIED